MQETHGAKQVTDIEKYMAENNVTQITFMPETECRDGEGGSFTCAANYSVVIGNNRYFGFTIEEAVRKAQ